MQHEQLIQIRNDILLLEALLDAADELPEGRRAIRIAWKTHDQNFLPQRDDLVQVYLCTWLISHFRNVILEGHG